MIETLGAIVGGIFIFAKVVGTFKTLLSVEEKVAPIVKQKLVNDRAEYLRAHVFESHQPPVRYCQEGQCVSLA